MGNCLVGREPMSVRVWRRTRWIFIIGVLSSELLVLIFRVTLLPPVNQCALP